MNKHSIITGVAIIIIILPFAYSGLNIFGAEQLEYRWNDLGMFSFFAFSNNGEMEFCNSMPFWINLQKLEIAATYNSDHIGSYVMESLVLNPFSSTIQKGVFASEGLSAAQHIFMSFDFEFNGGEVRLDPNKFVILVQTDTPILGLIPYSTTTQISGFEFDKMMNSEDLSCN